MSMMPYLEPLPEKESERGIRKQKVYQDINKIDDALKNGSCAEQMALHKRLDGMYQSCVSDWGKSMHKYIPEKGFNYRNLLPEYVKDNLEVMRAKLESFAEGWNIAPSNSTAKNQDITVNVSNTNEVNINISFDDVRKTIDEMGALTESETEEIKAKIDELEKIANEKSSKKKKWEKVKPIIAFALEKGVDVATQILILVVQMKLGK